MIEISSEVDLSPSNGLLIFLTKEYNVLTCFAGSAVLYSRASQAISNSQANTWERSLHDSTKFQQAVEPIETWSSCPPDVGVENADLGEALECISASAAAAE